MCNVNVDNQQDKLMERLDEYDIQVAKFKALFGNVKDLLRS